MGGPDWAMPVAAALTVPEAITVLLKDGALYTDKRGRAGTGRGVTPFVNADAVALGVVPAVAETVAATGAVPLACE